MMYELHIFIYDDNIFDSFSLFFNLKLTLVALIYKVSAKKS